MDQVVRFEMYKTLKSTKKVTIWKVADLRTMIKMKNTNQEAKQEAIWNVRSEV